MPSLSDAGKRMPGAGRYLLVGHRAEESVFLASPPAEACFASRAVNSQRAPPCAYAFQGPPQAAGDFLVGGRAQQALLLGSPGIAPGEPRRSNAKLAAARRRG